MCDCTAVRTVDLTTDQVFFFPSTLMNETSNVRKLLHYASDIM